MSNNNDLRTVWCSPAWITSIVGLIGCFLTIPDTVSNYFERDIDNAQSRQHQELDLVEKTLSEQGSERVFLLRYLSKTANDDDAKNWAKGEVSRLDDLARIQKEVSILSKKTKNLEGEINIKNGDNKVLKEELARFKRELSTKESEVLELKKIAGIENINTQAFVITVVRNTPLENNVYLNLSSVDKFNTGNMTKCYSSICQLANFGEAPKGISIGLIKDNMNFIVLPENFDFNVTVSSFPITDNYSSIKIIDYECKYFSPEEIFCSQNISK